MSDVDDIVDNQADISDTAPTRPSFGIALLIGYHAIWTDSVTRLYDSVDEMETDGFPVGHYLVEAAQAAKSQNPSLQQIMITRRAAPLTQTIWLTPTVTAQGAIYSGTFNAQPFTYTVLAGATVATICTALAALTAGFTGVTIANSTTRLTLTSPAGGIVDIQCSSNFAILDQTPDTTTDDTIAAANAELDGQDTTYYGVTVCDSQSKATALLAAAAIEPMIAIGVLQSPDDANGDPASTTDTMYAIKAASYTRTGVWYHRAIGGTEWLASAVMGGRLAIDPGQETWAFKTAAGTTFDVLTGAFKSAVDAKNGNIYVKVHGEPITWEGKCGSGRYYDATRFIDWENAQIVFNLFDWLRSAPKRPFTQLGLNAGGLVIESSLQQGVAAGGIDGVDTPPTVTVPKLSDTTTSDRAHRIARTYGYFYRLTGAIHGVVSRGQITV